MKPRAAFKIDFWVEKMNGIETPSKDKIKVAKGKAIVNLINLAPGENIKAILPVREFKNDQFIIMVTKNGVIKKTELSQFSNVSVKGIIAINGANEIIKIADKNITKK